MGCDGGTIPKRDELVKTKKKPEQIKKTERAFCWKHCAVTQQPLEPPVVSCELGRLYSKEAVLEALLNKEVPEVAAHIRNLKDVKELQFCENPAWDKESNAEVGDGYIDVQKAQWICPVSGQEMNGSFKFCFIWSCGCVLSDKVLKEVRKVNADSSECLRCQKPFVFDDVVIINPTEEEQTRQVEKMNNRRLLAKKKKSSKKRDIEAPSSTSNGASDIPKKAKISAPAAAASDANISGSAANDPNASETYKSLFTSHKTAQNQTKAHWVTYNPFYN